MMSAELCIGLAAVAILIFILTVLNRTSYTNIYRDKRYWNRNTFNEKYGKRPTPLCPTNNNCPAPDSPSTPTPTASLVPQIIPEPVSVSIGGPTQ
jgi:hypothetical protein